MTNIDSTEEFLKAYAADYEWEYVNKETTMRVMCEQQVYAPERKEDDKTDWVFLRFQHIAYGWFWAKYGSAAATPYTVVLITELDAMYAIVAKENHWDV